MEDSVDDKARKSMERLQHLLHIREALPPAPVQIPSQLHLRHRFPAWLPT